MDNIMTTFNAVYDRDHPHTDGYSVKIVALDWQDALDEALHIGAKNDRVLDKLEAEKKGN